MNVHWETMIAEMRASQQEADARRHFTEQGKSITTARALVAEWTSPPRPIDTEMVAAKSATNMRQAAQDDLFEVG